MLVDRGPFRRKVLNSYVRQMSEPNAQSVFDDFVAEILTQQGFSYEEDPRSVYEPEQLYTALKRYATDWTRFEFVDTHLEYGFRKAYKIFAKPKDSEPLRILNDQEVMSKALKLSKSSGLPLMTTKAKALTYSFDRERQVRALVKAPNPCVAYKRTQKGNKTRLVWGYPLEMTIMEARFARPLIDQFTSVWTPMAFGRPKVELGARLHRYFKDMPGTTVCLDYSKYDSTISACLIREAFRIMATWFRKKDLDEYGWTIMSEYFVSTPIVMPDGHLYTGKRHGVPSGSYFTQMVDSIVNVILCYALKSKFNLAFSPEQLLVLGDDVILQVAGHVTLEDVSQWARYLSKIGLILHDDEKTQVGVVHFLGAFWDSGKPDLPIQELVNKAVFPERFRNYEGKPHTGAEGVLRSYASSYLSAHRFLPTGITLRPRSKDMPPVGEEFDSRYLSGSDRFLFEEEKLLGRGHRSNEGPAMLSIRFMR